MDTAEDKCPNLHPRTKPKIMLKGKTNGVMAYNTASQLTLTFYAVIANTTAWIGQIILT
jgi:hypothetical protein